MGGSTVMKHKRSKISENKRMKFVAETIGLIAIVASVAFVGIELRQNTTAVKSATIQAISDQAMYFTVSMATDEHLPRLIFEMVVKGTPETELSDEDRMRMNLVVGSGLRRIENIYRQVEDGVLDRQALKSITFSFYQNQYVRDYWALNREFYDPEFALYWDEALADDRETVRIRKQYIETELKSKSRKTQDSTL